MSIARWACHILMSIARWASHILIKLEFSKNTQMSHFTSYCMRADKHDEASRQYKFVCSVLNTKNCHVAKQPPHILMYFFPTSDPV
jgi:hypothetical protein